MNADGKENWPELVALTSIFPVELPESNPSLYQGFWRPNWCFDTSRSGSVRLVTSGFVFES
jgi:hypothetical protein